MIDRITRCPACNGPMPNIRPARLAEERVVHCFHCSRELTIGEEGQLPNCPCQKEQRRK